MDVASPPEVNHVHPCVVRLFHVIVLYLFAICYALHELCLSVNECMYAILQFTVTWKVKCELNVLSILYMGLSVLDS